jgi:hypothetical protein
MVEETNHDDQKLKAAWDLSAEVAFCERNNSIEETPTKRRKFVHLGMYFITPMHLVLFLIMYGYGR